MAPASFGDAIRDKFRVDPMDRLCLNFATDGLGPGIVPLQLSAVVRGEKFDRYVLGGDPRRNADVTRIFHSEYSAKALSLDDVAEDLAKAIGPARPGLVVVNTLHWNQKTLPELMPQIHSLVRGSAMFGLTEAWLAFDRDGYSPADARTLHDWASKSSSLARGLPPYMRRKLRDICVDCGVEDALDAEGRLPPEATLSESTAARLEGLCAALFALPLKN